MSAKATAAYTRMKTNKGAGPVTGSVHRLLKIASTIASIFQQSGASYQ